ncbi:hypothetical protein Val02_78150 [Virgisporangium aliadipatigenens]|uniref:Uncharacterized protein n=1 Tax=Virgisporangium aliadipatigenens TaxID=741659 RepID=A0A8J3YSA0_9ACTN|nr:hypothetical protein [Virgisporangium aliadipatigenens]GIJ50929.1 hypothetical protein Val02_78150 [Virgisporangium aliadipatigenens]
MVGTAGRDMEHPSIPHDVGTLVVRRVSRDPSGDGHSVVDADVVSASNRGAVVRCLFRARLSAELAAVMPGNDIHYRRVPGGHDVRVDPLSWRFADALMDPGVMNELRFEHLDHHPALTDTADFTPYSRRAAGRAPVPIERPAPGEGVIVELRNRFRFINATPVITTGTTSSDSSEQWLFSSPAARYVLGPDVTAVRFSPATGHGHRVWGTRMTVRRLRDATPFTGSASGRTAGVLAYGRPVGLLQVEAEGPVVVFHYPDGTGRRLLLSSGGLFRGPLSVPPGPGLLTVGAILGTWSIRQVG